MGVFGSGELDVLVAYFTEHGFVVLRGLWDGPRLAAIEAECLRIQALFLAGALDERHGTTILADGGSGSRSDTFANYVTHVTDLSDVIRAAVVDPTIEHLMQTWLGDGGWLLESHRFGVTYQDARPGRESNYTRIGWHSDWQSGPNLDVWPSVAFTIHIDETSPANGFLRVVPGSQRWATPAPSDNINHAVLPEGSKPWGGYTPEPPPFEMPLGFGTRIRALSPNRVKSNECRDDSHW